MSEARITDSDVVRFLRFQKRLHFVCPRKIVAHWWECDCVGVTDSGFWHEVEVKHSAADFRADFEKAYTFKKHDVLRWKFTGEKPIPKQASNPWQNKNTLEALRPPNYFWFALPESLLSKVEIPDYAGVLIRKPMDGDGGLWRRQGGGLWKHREAPRLHSEKASPAFIADVGRALEYRLYDALDRIDELVRDKSRDPAPSAS